MIPKTRDILKRDQHFKRINQTGEIINKRNS